MSTTTTSPLTLTEYAARVGHNKYDWYFPVYDDIIGRRRDRFRLLEIGCSEQSLLMWNAAFPNARIVGLDKSDGGPTNEDDLPALAAKCDWLDFIQGDQTDMDLLKKLGRFDFVIDDGGHTMRQQQVTFATLFSAMRSGGWYFVEDLHTSYMQEYQDAPKTTDFIKWLLDDLHANYIGLSRAFPVGEIRLVDSLAAIRYELPVSTSKTHTLKG